MRYVVGIIVFLMCSVGVSSNRDAAINKTDRAVRYLVATNPARALHHNERYRARLVRNIVRASEEYRIPALLITMTAFKEGSFRMGAVGNMKETTMMQVHGDYRRTCNRKFDLDSQLGQLRCGSYWLARSLKKCDTWSRAMTRYMSGQCVSQSKRTHKKVKERINLWKKLENLQIKLTFRKVDEFQKDPSTVKPQITYNQIQKHIKKYFHHFYRCGPAPGDIVLLRLFVSGLTGKVESVLVIDDNDQEVLGACVADIMGLMKFKKFDTDNMAVDCLVKFG